MMMSSRPQVHAMALQDMGDLVNADPMQTDTLVNGRCGAAQGDSPETVCGPDRTQGALI
jgi:hypothetical protein